MDAGRRLGVEPVISAREMADPEVDHLGVMAYVARLHAAAVDNMSKPPRNSSPLRQHHTLSVSTPAAAPPKLYPDNSFPASQKPKPLSPPPPPKSFPVSPPAPPLKSFPVSSTQPTEFYPPKCTSSTSPAPAPPKLFPAVTSPPPAQLSPTAVNHEPPRPDTKLASIYKQYLSQGWKTQGFWKKFFNVFMLYRFRF